MASGGGFRVTELPADLSLCVLRRLRGHDLVAACQASRLWESLVRAEGRSRGPSEVHVAK